MWVAKQHTEDWQRPSGRCNVWILLTSSDSEMAQTGPTSVACDLAYLCGRYQTSFLTLQWPPPPTPHRISPYASMLDLCLMDSWNLKTYHRVQ